MRRQIMVTAMASLFLVSFTMLGSASDLHFPREVNKLRATQSAERDDLFEQNVDTGPFLISITPSSGHPGDKIVAKTRYIAPDKYATQMQFSLTPGTTFLGKTLSAVKTDQGADFEVEVPHIPQATHSSNGKFSIVITDLHYNPIATTNSLPFRYEMSPVILSINRNETQPGQRIIISGSGFDNPEVHFVINGGDNVGDLFFWTSTEISTSVSFSITRPTDALIYVRCGESKTGPRAIRLLPEMEVKDFVPGPHMLDVEFVKTANCGNQGMKCDHMEAWEAFGALAGIDAEHCSGPLGDREGDDSYFPNSRLKNGWVVDSIDFHAFMDLPGEEMGKDGNASIAEKGIGTDSPHLKVSWRVDHPLHCVRYRFSIKVKGPKGTNYE